MTKSLPLTLCLLLMAFEAVAGDLPTSPYYAKGLELYERGDFEIAASLFKEDLNENPGNYRSLFYLGMANKELGDRDTAIDQLKNALALSSEDPAFKAEILAELKPLERTVERDSWEFYNPSKFKH